MEKSMFRVPISGSNASRIYGDKIEEVTVKIGRKYLTDSHNTQYSSDALTDENGKTYFTEYEKMYSPEYLLYGSVEDAELYFARQILLSEFFTLRHKVHDASASELEEIISILKKIKKDNL